MRITQGSIAWTDVLLTAFAPAIWGSTYIVATELLPPDRPFTAALLRALPAGLLLALYCRSLPARGEWGRLVVLSALNIGFFQALLFVAAYRLPGGLAAVVGAIQPLLVMGLAWGADRRRPPRLAVGAAVLGIAGMAALLLSPAPRGTRSALPRHWPARPAWPRALPHAALAARDAGTGAHRLATAAGRADHLPMAWAFDPPLPALTGTQLAAYAYLSVVGALLAYALWFRGIARLSPVAVSSLGLLSPRDRGDPRLGAAGPGCAGFRSSGWSPCWRASWPCSGR